MEQKMHTTALRLGQRLAAVLTTLLALLFVGAFGFVGAIQEGAIEPPPWEMRLHTMRILAYRTDSPHCPPLTLCPPQSIGPAQAYYVIWSIHEPPTADQPYGRTARRLLVVPLQHCNCDANRLHVG
jgi:hypothetical protein